MFSKIMLLVLLILVGPERAFGDLIASSGITDEMLDSLIALKDFEGIQGLPPLSEIEDIRYEKNAKRSNRGDIEHKKQEEMANARVRQVDDKGRAYGTGRRKCSIARVWIQPGGGKFVVNDKEFDVYFPMLDKRAALLRPFSETKTLGMWDVNCTVKGGGTSGEHCLQLNILLAFTLLHLIIMIVVTAFRMVFLSLLFSPQSAGSTYILSTDKIYHNIQGS